MHRRTIYPAVAIEAAALLIGHGLGAEAGWPRLPEEAWLDDNPKSSAPPQDSPPVWSVETGRLGKPCQPGVGGWQPVGESGWSRAHLWGREHGRRVMNCAPEST